MINLTSRPLFIKTGRDLAFAFDRSIAECSAALESVLPMLCKPHFRAFQNLIAVLTWLPAKVDNVEEILQSWYSYATGYKEDIKKDVVIFSESLPSDCPRIHDFQGVALRNPIKLLFLLLYKNRAILLPYGFERPTTARWLDSVFKHFEVYPMCLASFQRLSDWEESYASSHELGFTYRGRLRIYSSGMKFFLTSDWYEPKDIKVEDMNRWKTSVKQVAGISSNEIPFRSMIAQINQDYPGELHEVVLEGSRDNSQQLNRQWLADCIHAVVAKYVPDSCTDEVHDLMVKVLQLKSLRWIDFGPTRLGMFDLPQIMAGVGIEISSALECWINCEECFLDDKQYENADAHLTQLGRLNAYVLIYLPVWRLLNPGCNVTYPQTPSLFNSAVHYDCKHESKDRPLSLIEFYRYCNLPVSAPSQLTFRLLFDCLIANPDLPGCVSVKQPVKKLPSSKKYPEVVKNIFPGEQFPLFVDYLYAIDVFMVAVQDHANDLYSLCASNRGRRIVINTEEFGFVPIVFFEGRVYPIAELDAGVFTFLKIGAKAYINPGSTRFSLFMLETGPRGQTAQWLDADSYDKAADRIASHPMQLTCLYLNTDKVHHTPIIIVSIVRALQTLDSQREWRSAMIANGATGFTKRVMYDRKRHSKWGRILPLFAADPKSGAPFSDDQYAKFWTAQCFSFQQWMRTHQIADEVLVAHLPLSCVKDHRFFTWDEWMAGVRPDRVRIIQYEELGKRSKPLRYLGDYCPVALRAKVTPHGARASFITSLSTVLCPSAIKVLTGQRESTAFKYNKGRDVLHKALQGVFNNKDEKLALLQAFDDLPSPSYYREEFEKLKRSDGFEKNAAQAGWFSIAPLSKTVKVNGLQLIASDRTRRIGYEYTHACACGFECPHEIIVSCGARNCAFCPYAIFNVNNIAAVAAKRQQVAEDFYRMCDLIEHQVAEVNVFEKERTLLSHKLESDAREVLQWQVIEESLWSMIVLARSGENPILLSNDKSALWTQISKFGVIPGSSEEFLLRLGEANIFSQSISEDFRMKIDRATRLLMARNGDVTKALLMPAQFSTVDSLIGMIRSRLDFSSLDMVEFTRLLNISSEEWLVHVEKFTSAGFLTS